MTRYVVTVVIESERDDLEGWSIRGVDFKPSYEDNVIESAVIKLEES